MSSASSHHVISGWGGFPQQNACVINPLSIALIKESLNQAKVVTPRGMGRSYGDSANGDTVIQTRHIDHFLAFDKFSGILTVEAGITLREILKIIVPKGWFLPVSPGTSFVSIGGAVASDVHGKNHHIAGTISEHLISMTIVLGSGETVTVSRTELPDLFHATCGGMGLTGIIVMVTIQLIPISSSFIQQTTIKASCLEELCEAFEINPTSPYSVAWIDCLTTGKNLGRGVLMLGDYTKLSDLKISIDKPPTIPLYAPSILLNHLSIKFFNHFYYQRATHQKVEDVALFPYFYPLDKLGAWNRLYGKSGFLQYQFVIPKDDGVRNMRTILEKIAASGIGSFLAVLKKFGAKNNNLLSFPIEGFTLALDFKVTPKSIDLLHQIDLMIRSMHGRVYLTKDAIMKEDVFKATYPRWQEFESIREKYGAIGKFASSQSIRLGLA
jgi:decaprenylphospho-beta-D-ribofuranose 2-oxidase